MALDENAVRRYQRSVLAVWDMADAETRAYGARWYADAYATAVELADRYGFTAAQAVGVIAALSPRVRWAPNVAAAATVLSWAEDARDGLPVADVETLARECGGLFRANVRKAMHVVALDDPLGGLNGPKERAFYRNIMGDTSGVTVDVWATRAATYGKQDHPRGKADYANIAQGYRRAARAAGTTPRDLQAAVWVAYRGSHL
jgi:hypothetical protein